MKNPTMGDLVEIQKEFQEAKEIYDEFKKMRKSIGKPLRRFIDPEQAKKDLRGEDFFSLMDDIKEIKNNETRKHRKNTSSYS